MDKETKKHHLKPMIISFLLIFLSSQYPSSSLKKKTHTHNYSYLDDPYRLSLCPFEATEDEDVTIDEDEDGLGLAIFSKTRLISGYACQKCFSQKAYLGLWINSMNVMATPQG